MAVVTYLEAIRQGLWKEMEREPQLAVNLAAVADADYKHNQSLMLNIVDDTIVADPNAEPALRHAQLLDARWQRHVSKTIDCCPNAPDRKSTRLNSSHIQKSRMPSSA